MSLLWPGQLVVKTDAAGKRYHDLDGYQLKRGDAIQLLEMNRKWSEPLMYDWDQAADDDSYDPNTPPLCFYVLGGPWEEKPERAALKGQHPIFLVAHDDVPHARFYLPENAIVRLARIRKVRERTARRMNRLGSNPQQRKPR
jgi:hypothetical protein